MTGRLDGKVALVTGAGGGIGAASARRLAADGAIVVLADIDANAAEAAATNIPGSVAMAVDLTEEPSVKALVEAIIARFGRIDVLHNNAGIAYGGSFDELSEAEIDALIAINFRGVVNGARAALPWLKQTAPDSCLLNTASASALYGTGGLAIYSATKFAVRGLTEALDTEWRDHAIKVRSLMPSFIDTPLLHGPANASSNRSKRESVVRAGLEFTPVEQVAQAAWDAVHGTQIHYLVGKTAKKMRIAAVLAPGYLRKRASTLMRTRLQR